MNYKTCSSCHKELPVTDFYKDFNGRDGYRADCKKCKAKKHPSKGLYKKRKSNAKEYPLSTTKVCTACGEEKKLNEYSVDFSGKYHRKSKCKKCISNENIKRKFTV